MFPFSFFLLLGFLKRALNKTLRFFKKYSVALKNRSLFASVMVGLFVTVVGGIILLWIDRRSGWFDKDSTETESAPNEGTQKEPVPPNQPCFEHNSQRSPLVEELRKISNVDSLLSKLSDYNREGKIAVGRREDFETPNCFYVFVVDEKRVYGVFLFQDEQFFELSGNPTHFPQRNFEKAQIWVIESERLVQN